MPHTVIYNSELHIVESKLLGNLTVGEVDGIVTEITQIARDKNCHLIFLDFREVLQKLSILQIYELPDRIRNILTSFEINVSFYKRANIVANDLDDYIFHENVMVNRGHNEKVFTDIDKAKEWLMENSAASQSQLFPCDDGYSPKVERP